MRSVLAAMVCACAIGGLAACGGDSGDDKEGNGGAAQSTDSGSKKAPGHAAVLSCLKEAGLEAEDQSSSMGKTIGIDYAAGRALVSFQKTAEDAESYASAAKSNGDSSSTQGTVAITVPDDPEAKEAQSTIEGCVESP